MPDVDKVLHLAPYVPALEAMPEGPTGLMLLHSLENPCFRVLDTRPDGRPSEVELGLVEMAISAEYEAHLDRGADIANAYRRSVAAHDLASGPGALDPLFLRWMQSDFS